jgi:hypothetical protein
MSFLTRTYQYPTVPRIACHCVRQVLGVKPLLSPRSEGVPTDMSNPLWGYPTLGCLRPLFRP